MPQVVGEAEHHRQRDPRLSVQLLKGAQRVGRRDEAPQQRRRVRRQLAQRRLALLPVSYTHLTLPTICSV
eukprot:5030086-Prymnesium_polylepis.2